MRQGLQSLGFSFEADSLTHFGGLFLIQRFCNKLYLRRRLERILKTAPLWDNYAPADLILVFLYVLIAGLPRINKTEVLHYNGLFLSLVGLKKFPDPTALRRFLHRLSAPAIRQIARLHDQLRRQLFGLPAPRSTLVFHLDSKPFRDSHRYRRMYKSASGVLSEVYPCTFLSSTPLSWGCGTILSSRWLPSELCSQS